jgi:AcrR family transcriptional regulator
MATTEPAITEPAITEPATARQTTTEPATARQAGRPERRAAPPTRRRGATLETALLQAAWDELTEVGYSELTMEGVAARAQTSRAVLYRRWPNRPELVVAALRHHTASSSAEVPDTGTLRGDVLALLRHVSQRVGEVAGVLSFLINDYFRVTGEAPAVLRERAVARESSSMDLILDRAIARGEISASRLTPRLAAMPVDLVRHDLIMTQAPIPDATIVEIVDQLFLPLLRGPDGSDGGSRPGATGT